MAAKTSPTTQAAPRKRTTKTVDPAEQLRQAVAEYERATAALAQARDARRTAMIAMRETGASYAQIAAIVGRSAMATRAEIVGR